MLLHPACAGSAGGPQPVHSWALWASSLPSHAARLEPAWAHPAASACPAGTARLASPAWAVAAAWADQSPEQTPAARQLIVKQAGGLLCKLLLCTAHQQHQAWAHPAASGGPAGTARLAWPAWRSDAAWAAQQAALSPAAWQAPMMQAAGLTHYASCPARQGKAAHNSLSACLSAQQMAGVCIGQEDSHKQNASNRHLLCCHTKGLQLAMQDVPVAQVVALALRGDRACPLWHAASCVQVWARPCPAQCLQGLPAALHPARCTVSMRHWPALGCIISLKRHAAACDLKWEGTLSRTAPAGAACCPAHSHTVSK